VSSEAPAKRSQHANATLLGATCCVHLATLLRVVGANLTIFKLEPTNTQHVAIGWPNAHNMLRPTMLRS